MSKHGNYNDEVSLGHKQLYVYCVNKDMRNNNNNIKKYQYTPYFRLAVNLQ